MATEHDRLAASADVRAPWRKWGPYLSERQWGTVREDRSTNGDAWNDFSHDQARSRAYRWGEDGIAGISDDRQHLCFALTVWNGCDPILKERLFGLTNSEGNHGEDVKECYFYLDSTPTHSYMKYLYKYPQRAYPYDEIVAVNKQRSRTEFEYELIDTGVFDDNRYFDVFVEYAKASPEDMLVRITVCNRGPEPSSIHLLPTLWFRNTWSWNTPDAGVRPTLRALDDRTIAASHHKLGDRFLYADGAPTLLFTENETNHVRLNTGGNRTQYVKDAFHNLLIHGQQDAVNPERTGTKAAARSTASSRTDAARRMSSIEASFPRRSTPTPRMSCGRRSPACSGRSSCTTTTSTSGCLSAARIHSRCRRSPVRATNTGITCTTTT
jgi:hypothetical protein